MFRLYRTHGVFALGALILMGSVFARVAFSEGGESKSTWKAPPRAAAIPNPIPADDKSLAVGKTLYVKECAACHGEGGHGNGPNAAELARQPTDLSAPIVRQEADGEIFWKITEGKKPMPRYLRIFKDEERWHIVNYIRSLSKDGN